MYTFKERLLAIILLLLAFISLINVWIIEYSLLGVAPKQIAIILFGLGAIFVFIVQGNKSK